MSFQQEPIKIEIPVEEEEPVFVPERGASGGVAAGDAAQRVGEGAKQAAARARAAWESERRKEAQARLVKGARYGARRGAHVSRSGLARGLNWLSARLAGLAERFSPVE